MQPSLQNLKILVTRPSKDAQAITATLRNMQAEVRNLELFAIESLANKQQIYTKILPGNLLICVSKNAAEIILPAVKNITNLRWATVGPGTARFLQEQGINNIIYPSVIPYDSMGLIAELHMRNINLMHKEIKIICGADGNDWLAKKLLDLGAKVETFAVYKRCLPDVSTQQLIKQLYFPARVDLIIITCVTSLKHLQILAQKHWDGILSIPLLVVSERIAKAALNMGFKQIMVALSMHDNDIIASVTKWHLNKVEKNV